MKYLFTLVMAASFVQLYSIETRDCQMIEEITSRSTKVIGKVSFPQLQYLKRQNLPNLVRFSSTIFVVEFLVFT